MQDLVNAGIFPNVDAAVGEALRLGPETLEEAREEIEPFRLILA